MGKAQSTHRKLGSLYLCCAATADDKAVRTQCIITKDILSECSSRTLGVGALFLGELAVILEVRSEELPLARKLAAGYSIQTLNGEFVYHLRRDELRPRYRINECEHAERWDCSVPCPEAIVESDRLDNVGKPEGQK